MKNATPLVELRNATKRFPGVVALDSVDFELVPGEVHVLLGENGAGKSTLINILVGSFSPSEGEYLIGGLPAGTLTPHKARLVGISPVFQEFSLAPELNVMQNLFMGREIQRMGILDKPAMKIRATELLNELGFEIDIDLKVGGLSRARQQMVEIAKALLQDIRVLILDEPTASLTEAEAAKLFTIVEKLKANGCGIIYVSHRMAEIRAIGDRVTVLRDGAKVGTVACDDTSDDALIEMMTGRRIDALFPKIKQEPSDIALEVIELAANDGSVNGASLTLRRGEVVGIAGLVGCGKSEVARLIFGLDPKKGGTITLRDGNSISNPTPRQMLQAGVCYFPSDRVREGLALDRPIRENITMAALDTSKFSLRGLIRGRKERTAAKTAADQFELRPADVERSVSNLSGGNRQKVMLARGILREIDVFLFDEPTVGVDVGAKAQIYEIIRDLVERGAAVLLISSELPEIIHLAHRAYVMRMGEVVAELSGTELTENTVLSAIFEDHGQHPPKSEVPV